MLKKKNISNGVRAMESEQYALPKERERRRTRAAMPWWASSLVIVFITIGLAVLDAAVLYSLFNAAMTQSSWLGKMISVGVALVLNLLPLVVARYLHLYLYALDYNAWKVAIAALVSFVILFGGTVVLRCAYADIYGEAQEGVLVNVMAETEGDGQAMNHSKSNATVFLLCCEPLATSILAFCLSYLLDDPVQRKVEELRLRRLELDEAHTDLLACQHEILQDMEHHELFALDDQRFDAKLEEIDARCNYLAVRARYLLAQHLQDPASISTVIQNAKNLDLTT